MDLPPTLSKPSPLLETSWIRWADRGGFLRRDIEMVMEGLKTKSNLLRDLQKKVDVHRREDLEQLRTARQETWTRWDERLKRLEEWMTAGGTLRGSALGLRAWQDAARWFDRSQGISQKYTERLERKAAVLEKRLADIGERLQLWMNRLILEELDLRGFIERQADKESELFVSSARKRPHLDFVYAEREEEGALSKHFKLIRQSTELVFQRQAKTAALTAKNADTSPAYFEIRKNSILGSWQPIAQRYTQIRDILQRQSESFEEGRQRLRSIYEMVQRMRVVQESVPPVMPRRRPLLHRLFNLQDD